jgi:type VI secretion system secreted protein Hcp
MAIYIKYSSPDISGDVTTAGFENQIEVNSFQWGVGRAIGAPTGASGNREAGTASVSEVTISKSLDNGSGGLLKEALGKGGKAKLVISFVRTDGEVGADTYLEVTLSDTMISGYNLSSGGDRPTESLSFNFVKIEMKFIPMKPDGTKGSPFPVTYDLGKQTLS